MYNTIISGNITQFKKLHKKIESQSQKSGVLFFRAVSGHEQKKQYDHQIAGVEILGQQPPQETGGAGIACL